MHMPTLLVIVPIAALLAGVVFATFYHKYDTRRNLFLDLNLSIEDLSGIGGNIISLQKDQNQNIVWIVSGKWNLDIESGNLSKGSNSVDFGANFSMQSVDGITSEKASLSNYTLVKSHILDEVASLDGTASLVNTGNAISSLNATGQNRTIPLHIIISNGRTISISSDSDSFHNYFSSTPIYGNVPARD
jgi:hypothetical protein